MPSQINFEFLWICINMQKISLFRLFILQIQSILESHHQTGHAHFLLCPSQNFQLSFILHEFFPACNTSGHYICSFLRYKSRVWDRVKRKSQSPETRLASPIFFDHTLTKTVSSTFNFCEFPSTCKKWDCFIHLFWKNNWFKNPAISLA